MSTEIRRTQIQFPTENYPSLEHHYSRLVKSGVYEGKNFEENMIMVAGDNLIAAIKIIQHYTTEEESYKFLDELIKFAKEMGEI